MGVPISEVLEAAWQLVVYQLREAFTKFKEEFLAGLVLVGKHVEIEVP